MSAYELASRWRASAPRLTGLPLLEGAIAVVFVFLFSQALLGPLFADEANPEASTVLRLIWPPVYAATLALMLTRPGASVRYLLAAWPFLALALLALFSLRWSIDPGVTTRRGIAIVATTLFGVWLASAFSWRDMLRVIASGFAILAVFSFLAGALVPGFGVMHEVHVGAWKGLWWEKNTLGAMMAWATLAFLAAGALDDRFAWLWRALVPLAVLLVLLSTSKTSLLACMVALAGPLAIALVRRDFSFAALTFTGAGLGMAALLAAILIGPAAILEMLGRDPTLTGRIPIWNVLIDLIATQPWTGFGYGAFWESEGGPVHWVRLATAWDVPTAHNAWIETALGLGIPGVLLAAFAVLRAVVQAASRLFAGREIYWALPFLVVWAMISLTESNLLQQNSLIWVMLVATAAKLAARDQA